MATAGANGAGVSVVLAARAGVGTMMMALPPGAVNVGLVRGWAAPPLTIGRAALGVATIWAAGDGEDDPPGFAAAPPGGVGGAVGAAVQAISRPTTSSSAVIRRRCSKRRSCPGNT